MRRLFRLSLLLILIPAVADAQDTIATIQGKRILAHQTRIGKFNLHFTRDADSTSQKLNMRQVYFIRYENGQTWPPAIGKSRQRSYSRSVMRETGDTALAMDRLPLRPSGNDTITTFMGTRIIASGTTLNPLRTRYKDAATGAASVVRTRKVYRIRYAEGRVWPQEQRAGRKRDYAWGEAERSGNWEAYVKKYASARHQILICTPSFHNTGNFPGISVGLSYYATIDSAARFSVGATFGKMWAGTWETGELYDGDRRANIQMTYAIPTLRYHLADKRSLIDPFVGIGAALGSYRKHEIWMTRSRTYTDVPTTYFMVAPQVELGFNVTNGRLFSMQILASGGPQFTGGRRDGYFATLGLIRMGFRF